MLTSYASYFVSFFLSNARKSVESIERIILYGSVARGEETKESDIDLFIEVKKKTIALEKEIHQLELEFYNSREFTLFKAQGANNKFSIKIGILTEWKELYASVASTGIVLYGPYEAQELPSGVSHNIIIFWDRIERNRGSFLNKVYGFNSKGKHYDGLLTHYGGKKIGKSSIMIPVIYKKEFFTLLKEYTVHAKSIEVFS